jgi:hypothetical protein
VAVGTGEDGAQRIGGVDTANGHELWDRPLNGYPMTRTQPEGSPRTDEMIVLAPDGAVQIMSIATGQTRPAGHVVAGSEAVFEWRDLLAVRRHIGPDDAQDEFLVYQLGTDEPLWRKELTSNGPAYAPCGIHLCAYDSSGYDRIDPLTGRLVAAFNPDAPDPYRADEDQWRDWRDATGVGQWELIAMYAGHVLVRLDPSFAQDKQTWLGEATLHGRTITIRPLMAIGPRANSCSVEQRWLFCDGSAVDDAVSVRLSELDKLLAGPARG